MIRKLLIKIFPQSSRYSPLKSKIIGYSVAIAIYFLTMLIITFSLGGNSNDFTEITTETLPFIIIAFVFFELIDLLGKWRHKSILETNKISKLHSIYNFEIENVNHSKYWGYKGVYKNYFFRIYYDWSAGMKKNGSRFCFMLHYKPQMISKDYIDGEKLSLLTKKHNKRNTYNYEIKFNTSYLIIYMRYNFFTEFEEFKRKLDLAVKIAIEENLEPNTEREVDILLSDKKLEILHAPEIDTYFEN